MKFTIDEVQPVNPKTMASDATVVQQAKTIKKLKDAGRKNAHYLAELLKTMPVKHSKYKAAMESVSLWYETVIDQRRR